MKERYEVMETVYQETTGGKDHVWGYFIADLYGAIAGLGVAAIFANQTGSSLVAVFAGLVVAALVGGGLLMLVCCLAGTWDEEVAPYFGLKKKGGTTQNAVTGVANLKTNRRLWMFLLLNFLTFGIYSIVAMYSIGEDIDTIAGRYDGRKTMNFFLLLFLVSWLTLGIGVLVWYHRLSARIGMELKRRNIDHQFGAGTFWCWNLLGLITVVGPLVYLHKLCEAMNLLCKDYNLHY